MSRRKRDKKKAAPRRPPEPAPPNRWDGLRSRVAGIAGTPWAAAVVLVLVTFAVYARSIGCPLVYVDDNLYILRTRGSRSCRSATCGGY